MAIRRLIACWLAVLVTALLSGCALDNPAALVRRIDLLGSPAAVGAGQRTVVIAPETVSVDVTAGETVRFVVGAHSFAWNFQVSPTVTMFVLNQIAPPGMLARPVAVYVAANPLYISNS